MTIYYQLLLKASCLVAYFILKQCLFFKVMAYDNELTGSSSSLMSSAKTFQNPGPVQLLAATTDSLLLSWISPADNSVTKFTVEYAEVICICKNSFQVIQLFFNLAHRNLWVEGVEKTCWQSLIYRKDVFYGRNAHDSIPLPSKYAI